MSHGIVARKKYLLGDVYPGQDLCWCKISIGANAIAVTRFDGTRVRQTRFVDDESEVLVLKAKLRVFARRMLPGGRWFLDKSSRESTAHLIVYYPSMSWYTPMRPVQRLNLGLWAEL